MDDTFQNIRGLLASAGVTEKEIEALNVEIKGKRTAVKCARDQANALLGNREQFSDVYGLKDYAFDDKRGPKESFEIVAFAEFLLLMLFFILVGESAWPAATILVVVNGLTVSAWGVFMVTQYKKRQKAAVDAAMMRIIRKL